MFKVLKPGLQTTYQDMGRFGYREMGVPLSGAMDQNLAGFANSLFNNQRNAVVIEFTVIGPLLEVLENVEVAICGMGLKPLCDNQPLPINQKVVLQKGQQLKVGSLGESMRGYMAVSGGFDVVSVLGSCSYYPSLSIPKIERGSLLKMKREKSKSSDLNIPTFDFDFYNNKSIKVAKGPEFELLGEELKQELFKTNFKINPQSNRMATLFDKGISMGVKEIITAPVQPGTVQLTPSGSLVVLMRDAQATGGYGRIFQLTPDAINLLAQKPTGLTIKFKVF
ncbi:MAG: biotin-dependent carboxyltransferase family protein [Flavobacteriaceae bacterium]|nr:biotin-dependent carboxyltransferase family protein [Flavobacteriaceae bacterium]